MKSINEEYMRKEIWKERKAIVTESQIFEDPLWWITLQSKMYVMYMAFLHLLSPVVVLNLHMQTTW